jgi:hypothetical protein
VHLEVGVVTVGFAREQALELALAGLLAQPLQRRLGVGDHRVVVLGLGELDQPERVLEVTLDLAIALDAALEARPLTQQRLGRRGFLPEIWVLDEGIELG